MDYTSEIIDLTGSFSHNLPQDLIIIDLDNDTEYCANDFLQRHKITRNKSSVTRTSVEKVIQKERKSSTNKENNPKDHCLSNQVVKNADKTCRWGECPICWDALGRRALASTKCGHVYCMKCLEHSLKIEKKCPTCRTVLKGSNSYHPLYL